MNQNVLKKVGEIHTASRQMYHASWLHNHNILFKQIYCQYIFCVFVVLVSFSLFGCCQHTAKNVKNCILCKVKRYQRDLKHCSQAAEKSSLSLVSKRHADSHGSRLTLLSVMGCALAVLNLLHFTATQYCTITMYNGRRIL